MQVEFSLHIYFAVFPLLPKPTSSQPSAMTPPESQLGALGAAARQDLTHRMKALKHYLETQGAGLATSGQYLPYYALPYVPQPHLHPSFQHMFTAEWVAQQRATLAAYLEGIPSTMQLPLLYTMLDSYTASLAAAGARQGNNSSTTGGLAAAATAARGAVAGEPGEGRAIMGRSYPDPILQSSSSAAAVAASAVADGYSRPVSALLQGQVQLQDFIPAGSAACLEGSVAEGLGGLLGAAEGSSLCLPYARTSWGATTSSLSAGIAGSQGYVAASPAAAAGPDQRAKTAAVGFRASKAGACTDDRDSTAMPASGGGENEAAMRAGEGGEDAGEQYSEDYEASEDAEGGHGAEEAGDGLAAQAAAAGERREAGPCGVCLGDEHSFVGGEVGGPSVLSVPAVGDPSIVELGLAEMSSVGMEVAAAAAGTAAGEMQGDAATSEAVDTAAAAAAGGSDRQVVEAVAAASHLKQCQEECTELAAAGLLAPLNYQQLQKDLRVSQHFLPRIHG